MERDLLGQDGLTSARRPDHHGDGPAQKPAAKDAIERGDPGLNHVTRRGGGAVGHGRSPFPGVQARAPRSPDRSAA